MAGLGFGNKIFLPSFPDLHTGDRMLQRGSATTTQMVRSMSEGWILADIVKRIYISLTIQ